MGMGKVYFIADAHLGVESAEREAQKVERLLLFLETIRAEAAHLFILGDLFDFWFEYRSVIPKDFYPVISELHRLAKSGVDIHYVCGNHDWWQRDFFHQSVGMEVSQGPLDIVLSGRRLFLAHGDGLAERHLGDRVFNKMLRNRLNISLFTFLHPDLGMSLGRKLSRLSRRNNRQMGTDFLLDFAKKRFLEGFDYVILAHTHSPTIYREGTRVYVNVGDWMKSFTYAEMDSSGIELRQFMV